MANLGYIEQGKLSMMVGGDAATFDRVKPLLEDVGPTNEFLTAARGAGLSEKDFAALFHLLARLSGVSA